MEDKSVVMLIAVIAVALIVVILGGVGLGNRHYQQMAARGCTQGAVPGVGGWVWICPQAR